MLRMWYWGPMRRGVYYIEGYVLTIPHNPNMFLWTAPDIGLSIGADVVAVML